MSIIKNIPIMFYGPYFSGFFTPSVHFCSAIDFWTSFKNYKEKIGEKNIVEY